LREFNPNLFKSLSIFQLRLTKHIDLRNRLRSINTISGADVYYSDDKAKASVCVLDYNTLNVLERVVVIDKVNLPYISGYLCFREGFILLKAISKLNLEPDCFIFDGNGILHHRRMGLATFLGIILKKPTIGCAKTLLLGDYNQPKRQRGSFSYIGYQGKKLGAALRTKTGIKEIYVSQGWGISLRKAKNIVLGVCKYRVPEPLRLAHLYSKPKIW